MEHGTNPKWVSVNNEIVQVSEIIRLYPFDRPKAFCPLCNEVAILKLGNHNIHHFAHKPPYTCALNNPETALHYNIKMYIYNELRLNIGGRLFISQKCSNKGCQTLNRLLFLENWDDVKVETTYNEYIPDISLLKNNQVIGIIEIFVSHLMGGIKINYLEGKNIPCLEIDARTFKDEGPNRWTIQKDIPYKSIVFHSEWICDECLNRNEEKQNYENTIKHAFERPRIVEYNAVFCNHAVKMIDFYFSNGAITRQVYLIKGFYVKGILYDLRAYDLNNNVCLQTVDRNINGFEKILDHKVNEAIKIIEQSSRKTDTILQWQKCEPYEFDFSDSKYPHKYKWNSEQRAWD